MKYIGAFTSVIRGFTTLILTKYPMGLQVECVIISQRVRSSGAPLYLHLLSLPCLLSPLPYLLSSLFNFLSPLRSIFTSETWVFPSSSV